MIYLVHQFKQKKPDYSLKKIIMKKIGPFIVVFLSLFILSCEGPQGPAGFDGIDGDVFEAEAFEINVDMTFNSNANTFEYLASNYSNGITVLESDVVLIYRLEEVINGLDIWRQLPQPIITENGTAFYNFDFTSGDYSIYLEPEFDASLTSTNLTDNQWFRIVVVPAVILNSGTFDKTNLSSLLENVGIDENSIETFTIN